MKGNYVRLLAVPATHDARAIYETIPSELLGDGSFRLLFTPGLVEGLAAGDIIRVHNDRAELVTQGENRGIWFFFSEAGENRGRSEHWFRDAVGELGGRLDGGGQTSLVFTVPRSIESQKLQAFFDAARQRFPGAEWIYSNT